MSADEIRRLAGTLKVWREECGVRPVHIWDAYVKMENALLDYSAMVERCEEALKCNFVAQDGRTTINSAVKAQVNYILKGATDERK